MIIHGSGVRRRIVGSVPEYCRLCQQIGRFQMVEVETTDSVYFVTVGSASAGRLIECGKCGLAFGESLRHRQRPRAPKGAAAELLRESDPELWSRLEGLVDEEGRVRAGKAAPEVRRGFVREALDAADALVPQVYARKVHAFNGLPLTVPIVLVGMSWFLLVGAWAVLNGFYFNPPLPKEWGAVVFMIPPTIMLPMMATLRRRLARRHVVPALLRGLTTLEATKEELQAEWSLAQGRGNALTGYISFPAFWGRVQDAYRRGSASSL